MTVPPPLPKINFRSLYSKFKFKVVRHFLLTILRVILIQIIFGSIVELFQVKQMPNNFTAILVPKPLQKFLNPEKLSIPKSLFIVIGLGLVSFYAFIYY